LGGVAFRNRRLACPRRRHASACCTGCARRRFRRRRLAVSEGGREGRACKQTVGHVPQRCNHKHSNIQTIKTCMRKCSRDGSTPSCTPPTPQVDAGRSDDGPRESMVCGLANLHALPTFKHANLRTCREHANLRTCEPANMRTFEHANLRTCEPANHQNVHVFTPANLRSQGARLRLCVPTTRMVHVHACPLTYFRRVRVCACVRL